MRLIPTRRKPPHRRVREGLPLSPNEERYVLDDILTPEIFGNPWTVRIRGPLDWRRFEDALRKTCERHEGRRTGYEPGEDGQFTRFVEADVRLNLIRRSVPGGDPAEVRRLIEQWYYTKIDLTPATLHRFLLIQVAREEFLFGYSLHHMTSDGESKDAFMDEAFKRYAGVTDFAPVTQFSDVWTWDWATSPAYVEAEAFWTNRLGAVGEVRGLAEDTVQAPGEPWPIAVHHLLEPGLVADAKAAAALVGVTEFTFYYAVCHVLLTRLIGAGRITSTFQSGGRRSVPGAEGVHGVFSNGLILATEVDETQSVRTLAERLRSEIRAAVANEAYPYHHVIRSTGVAPRFGINWFPRLPVLSAPGLEISRPDMSLGRYEYDLNLRFVRDDETGAIDLVIFYRETAIGRDRVVSVGEQFEALLRALARDVDAPVGSVRSVDLAPSGRLPDPTAELPRGGGELIHAAFLRRAAETPEATALVHAGGSLSYGQLEARSRDLAQHLRALGVGPGDRVAILAERGPALVWAMLAAARIGAAFVTLDASYPEPRLESFLQICTPKVLVRAGGTELVELAARLSSAVGQPPVDANAVPADSTTAGLDLASPETPAYFLFTSGSTGAPKCVACSHEPLSRFVRWQVETFGLEAGDRFTLLAGLSHDPLLRDVFTPLSIGATLLIPSQATVTEPESLGSWFREVRPTVSHLTPPLGQVLAAGVARVQRLGDLRHLFWGGDQLTPTLVTELAGLAPNARQINFYGSTETPQAAGWFDCVDDMSRKTIPVGRGAAGYQLLVVDAERRPVGAGEAGEIAVRSNNLSLGNVEAGRIRPRESGETYYTGDRGLYLPSGDVLLLGRTDDQVKVRGHRVDLSEVTAALLTHPAVRSAIALPVGEGAGLKVVAFVSTRRRSSVGETELAAYLGARLPAYMLPHRLQVLASLPLLPNSKIDRQALFALAASDPAPQAASHGAVANETERALIERWSALLDVGGISRDTSFIALGGDSLSYVQGYLATEEVIGVTPPGWQLMSIAELAAARREPARFWSVIDTPMLIRAIAIFVVVAGHLHLLRYGGGATTGLLVVSGFLFGGLQLREVFSKASAQPVLRGLWKLFAPVMLFSVALFTAKALAGKDPNLSTLFLGANLQDYSKLSGPHWGGHEFFLWFIHCLLQMLALIYLSLLLLKKTSGFRIGQMRFAMALFLAGCVGRFLAPAIFYPDFFLHGPPRFTPVSFLPTTHLATFMLGVMIATAETRREKAWVGVALVAYAAVSAWFYSPQQALVVLASGGAIMVLRRVPLPKPVAFLALMLSGASLFIYLTHFLARGLLRQLGAPEWPLLQVAVGIASGVVFWWAWTWATAFVARLSRQPAVLEPQAAI